MPGRRFTLYLLLIAAMGLGLVFGEPLFFTLAYFVLGTTIVSLLWTWTGLLGLRLEREVTSQRGQVGRTLDETLTIHNLSFVPRLWLEVHDHSTVPGHMADRVLVGVPPRGRRSWQVRTHCTHRGRYRLGPMTLVSGDPFGFFERKRPIPRTTEILIYPATFAIHGLVPEVGRLPGGEAVRQRTHVITPNAAGIREYAPGDSLRQIHWLSSAHRGRLMVKEFEMDPMADFWVVLDNHEAVHVPENSNHPLASTEEYGVTIAASLAKHFLQKDRSVGLVTYAPDRALIQADRGARQLRKILELLAVTQATGSMALGNVLRLEGERFARTTTVLVVTPSVEADWLGAARWLKYRRVRVIVIHIDPASFGGPAGAESILKALHKEGVTVYPVRRGDNLSLALSRRPGSGR